MKQFIVLTNGQIIDIKNVNYDPKDNLVIKGEKLYKIYKSRNSLYDDERIEIGIIDSDYSVYDEARSRAFDCRVEHLFSLLEEDKQKDCNHYNDCSICWRFCDGQGVCGDDLVEVVKRAYFDDKLCDEDKIAIQKVVMKDDFNRQELRAILRKIGEKYF